MSTDGPHWRLVQSIRAQFCLACRDAIGAEGVVLHDARTSGAVRQEVSAWIDWIVRQSTIEADARNEGAFTRDAPIEGLVGEPLIEIARREWPGFLRTRLSAAGPDVYSRLSVAERRQVKDQLDASRGSTVLVADGEQLDWLHLSHAQILIVVPSDARGTDVVAALRSAHRGT